MGAAASSSASASVDRDFQGSIRQVRHTPHSFARHILSSAPILFILLIFSLLLFTFLLFSFLASYLFNFSFPLPFFSLLPSFHLLLPPLSVLSPSLLAPNLILLPSFCPCPSTRNSACNAPFPVQHLPS
jgi:hypothetical protein